ncbi:DNA topoisomerase [Pseudomonas sp. KCJK8993]|uniref:DNA topoisomerase n=1 Tax=Pseudomonas sp. KCJK8993 TaxID=3344565 RepID=UPI00390699F0
MKLMIIEAPGKLKKLAPMLKKLRPGEHWEVVASGGHIRDLPEKGHDDTMITAGVLRDLRPVYTIRDKSSGRIKTMRAALARATEIYIATDPDREGESIAWHIQQTLRIRDYKRIAFNEVTQSRVKEALANPRKIDAQLVASQECRRVLDRLVGYLVTGELRRVLGLPTTAGRVQSVAVYLVVLREREIRNFKVVHHFGVRLQFQNQMTSSSWMADWVTVPDFASKEHPYVQDGTLAAQVAGVRNVIVESCEDSKERRAPYPPYISSTLQQAASVALKWDPDKTMQIAQRLYEQGVITYHRTDNPNVGDDVMGDIRAVAQALGIPAVEKRREFRAAEGAQLGHPAIAPTTWADEVAGEDDEQRQLYKLIRIRALASQLADAIYDARIVKLLAKGPGQRPLRFSGSCRTVAYRGWMQLLAGDDTDEEGAEAANNEIPKLEPKQILPVLNGEVLNLKTKAPPRYTKASLVKELERQGIGRPGTFASIIKNITSRSQVIEEKRKLVPGPLGEQTIAQLEGRFSFVQTQFTSSMERALDKIADGQSTYNAVVSKFYEHLQRELSSLKDAPSLRMQSARSSASTTTEPEHQYLCGKCGKHLVRRQKRGEGGYDFWACSGYRDTGCKVSYPSNKGKPDLTKARGL